MWAWRLANINGKYTIQLNEEFRAININKMHASFDVHIILI